MRSVSEWRKYDVKGRTFVLVVCPGCHVEYRLNHDIDEQGVVTPSLDCPDDICLFHDTVILVGWSGPAVEKSGKA